MKKLKLNKIKCISFACGLVLSVTVSGLFAFNKTNTSSNNKLISIKTSHTKYAFGNTYTYDDVPKYMMLIPELVENTKTKLASEKTEEEITEEQPIEEEKQEEKPTETVVVEKKEEPKQEEQQVNPAVVYDNMTLDELTEKLNKSLNSTVAGQGYILASYSLEKGVDPYIATAIMLHETGCKWTCSPLARNNYNFGGIKSSSGGYKSYESVEDGLRGYIDNLSNGYFSIGLNTVDAISRKYTGYENSDWSTKVYNYIESIKAQ